jgi:Uma2 family endonuclease
MLSRAEYRRWAEAQPRGRYERVAGEVVAMAPERVAHVRVKAQVWLALDRAIRAAGLPCEALADGITVEVGDDTDYEPDAVVNCGERIADDEVAAPNPVIVVEALSPSTQSVDTGAKLADYFKVPSVRHCLIVRADRRAATHHRRRDDGDIETRLLAEGRIALHPPGIEIAIEDFYAE